MPELNDTDQFVTTKAPKEPESTGDPRVNGNEAAPGIETIASSIIEQPDLNYLHELSQINMGNLEGLDASDHIAMRKWLKEVYVKLPKNPETKRVRTSAAVAAKNVPITYGSNENFSIRIYDPTPDSGKQGNLRPALLMFHGGGWIHGFPEVDEELSIFFASELRAVVIGVDYRLAPEHPFPAALNDCFEALNWTVDHAPEHKIDPGRVGLWGGSAGANLAAALALKDSNEHKTSRIRHANLVVPVTCHPDFYPAILKSSSASMQAFPSVASSAEANLAGLKELWAKYSGDLYSDPYASVLLSHPQKNHPPVHITAAGCDGLRDEGIAYALHLRNAGIDTQLEIVPGVPHGINASPKTIVVGQFFRNQARVLNCALNTDF